MKQQKENTGYTSELNRLGFEGSIQWINNEEGSGAKFYKSSVYFPDSLTNPKTYCGVTIDPGVDMGTGDLGLINLVINNYILNDILSKKLAEKLKSAIGERGRAAALWMKENRLSFRNNFLVPVPYALNIMEKITAPSYWSPLVKQMGTLLQIRDKHIKQAVHTALLSMSYNRGPIKTIALASEFIISGNYDGLAKKIANIRHSLRSLNERRDREAELIYKAIELKNDFVIEYENLNPMPVTEIPSDRKEMIMKMLEFEIKHVELII